MRIILRRLSRFGEPRVSGDIHVVRFFRVLDAFGKRPRVTAVRRGQVVWTAMTIDCATVQIAESVVFGRAAGTFRWSIRGKRKIWIFFASSDALIPFLPVFLGEVEGR